MSRRIIVTIKGDVSQFLGRLERASRGLESMRPPTLARAVRVWLAICAIVLAFLAAMWLAAAVTPAATAKPCTTITKCRSAAAWNHKVLRGLNLRIAIANGRAGGGRALTPCHTLGACRGQASAQKHDRVLAAATWAHIHTDNTPHGAMLIVRYLFFPCGTIAQTRAHLIVTWESGWSRFEINGAGDTGWWQFELGDTAAPHAGFPSPHPDISVAEAEDAWWSTSRAVRDSKCGTDFSPEWSSVRDHGEPWG